jgi:hypothetical protein
MQIACRWAEAEIYARARMTAEALQAGRQRAEATGRRGKVLLNGWLTLQVKAGRMKSAKWI